MLVDKITIFWFQKQKKINLKELETGNLSSGLGSGNKNKINHEDLEWRRILWIMWISDKHCVGYCSRTENCVHVRSFCVNPRWIERAFNAFTILGLNSMYWNRSFCCGGTLNAPKPYNRVKWAYKTAILYNKTEHSNKDFYLTLRIFQWLINIYSPCIYFWCLI